MAMSKEHIRLAVAFVLGAVFGPMVIGFITGALGRVSSRG